MRDLAQELPGTTAPQPCHLDMPRIYLVISLVVLIALLGVPVLGLALATQPLSGAKPSQPPPVDAARLQAHVRFLTEDVYPRSADQHENLERAARYIARQFNDAGAKVALQSFPVQGKTYRNIIARFGPDKGPLLVIGAHYDSNGGVSDDPRGYSPLTHTPGADDNASGVAGLIELARLLAKEAPDRPVELVAYTLEEAPYFASHFMGSAWHARALKEQKREVALMLSLEMIGYFNDTPGSQQYPVPAMRMIYPDRGNFIGLVGKFGDGDATRKVKALMAGATDLPVESINAPASMPGIDLSDHRSYWNEGFRAMMVTDTAFYRNPHYHRAEDTFEKLDYARMAKVVQAVYAVAQRY